MGIPDLSRSQEGAREKLSHEALGNLSHDLNNALSVILTSSTSLLRREPTDPTARRQLELVHRSALRIHALSEELSDALAIESGQLDLKLAPLETGQVMHEAVEAAQQLAPQRSLRFSSSAGSLWIRGDHLRLQRVFAHLLRSVLSARLDGTVEVLLERRTGEVCVKIQEASAPLSSASSSPSSDAVSRLSPLETQRHSLARYVSHGVVRAHGGRLWIEPLGDSACAYLVSLPISEHAPVG